MERLRSDVVQHMLEAADAREYSVLLNTTDQWDCFVRWCQMSSEASHGISRTGGGIETFCLDRESRFFCVAMSLETLDEIVRSLIESYENETLEKLFH